MQTLHERVTEEIIRRDMTVTEFVKEINIANNTYVRLARSKPSTKTYAKIAKFLDEPISQVLKYPIHAY